MQAAPGGRNPGFSGLSVWGRLEVRMMARIPSGFTKREKDFQYRFTVEGKRYSVYGQTIKECREKELQKREEPSTIEFMEEGQT